MDSAVIDVTDTVVRMPAFNTGNSIPAGKVLDKAHKQWASRPADERFQSLDALLADVKRRKDSCMQKEVKASDLRAEAHPDYGVVLRGPSGHAVQFNNWSFSQLCHLIGAPAYYLPSLPNNLAADCINEGLAENGKTMKALIQRTDGLPSLRAMNGSRYARVWDSHALGGIYDLVRASAWKLPLAYKDGRWGAELVPSGAYAGDRNSFLFMVDESRPIEINGRRLSRGFFFWNSEVGASTIGMDLFLYDHVCSNHYVWGGTVIAKLRKRHIGKALEAYSQSEISRLLTEYAECSLADEEAVIRRAHDWTLDKEPVEYLRTKGFAKFEAEGGVASANQEEGDCRTLWQAIQGLTAYARVIPNRDTRTDLERRAGKLLEVVR